MMFSSCRETKGKESNNQSFFWLIFGVLKEKYELSLAWNQFGKLQWRSQSCIEDPKAAFRLKSDLLASWNHMGSLRAGVAAENLHDKGDNVTAAIEHLGALEGGAWGPSPVHTVTRCWVQATPFYGTTTTHLHINTKTNTQCFSLMLLDTYQATHLHDFSQCVFGSALAKHWNLFFSPPRCVV